MPRRAPTPTKPADEEEEPPFLRTTLRGCSTGLVFAWGERGADAAAAAAADLDGGGDSGDGVELVGPPRGTPALEAEDAPADAVAAVHAAAVADAAVPAGSAEGCAPRRQPAAVDTVPEDAAADGQAAQRPAASRLAADDDVGRDVPDMGDAAATAAVLAGGATTAADGEHPGTQPPPPSRSWLTDAAGAGTAGAAIDALTARLAAAFGNRAGLRPGLGTLSAAAAAAGGDGRPPPPRAPATEAAAADAADADASASAPSPLAAAAVAPRISRSTAWYCRSCSCRPSIRALLRATTASRQTPPAGGGGGGGRRQTDGTPVDNVGGGGGASRASVSTRAAGRDGRGESRGCRSDGYSGRGDSCRTKQGDGRVIDGSGTQREGCRGRPTDGARGEGGGVDGVPSPPAAHPTPSHNEQAAAGLRLFGRPRLSPARPTDRAQVVQVATGTRL